MSAGVISKVLVIDDSNTIRRSAEIFLKQGGHQVAQKFTNKGLPRKVSKRKVPPSGLSNSWFQKF